MTEDFPWGEVVKLHKIDGLPAIVEYKVGLTSMIRELSNSTSPAKVAFRVAMTRLTKLSSALYARSTRVEALCGMLLMCFLSIANWITITNLEVKTMNRNPEPDWRDERDAEDDEIPERDDELPPSNTFK